MLPDPFIGQFIRSLISELKRLSNKQFRDECRLDPVEVLGVEKRISLNALVLGKISIAQSLTELSSEIHSAGQFLTLNHQIKYGYERVYLKYHELLNQRWVLAADKYKEGYDPNPKLEFRTCAYGLIEIDLELLAELRSILDEAEQVIREAPLPDLVPQFRIDHLATDLQNAGIPLAGLNVADKPSPESDATPCEYFKLENGKFVRVTKEADVTFTDAEKQLANEIILAHEQEIEKRDKILESVRLGLISSWCETRKKTKE
jgi:hypothetical protein